KQPLPCFLGKAEASDGHTPEKRQRHYDEHLQPLGASLRDMKSLQTNFLSVPFGSSLPCPGESSSCSSSACQSEELEKTWYTVSRMPMPLSCLCPLRQLLKCSASDGLRGAIMSFGLCETSVDDDTDRIKVEFQFLTLPNLGFGARIYQNVSKVTEKRRFTLLGSGRN
ncbi:unnamed protein product, partial [Heterotrigona itama]